ncbi:MAG TPA: histidine phosphatase family protein [Hyphomicrobium sp.]|nr:histidine phosphatase family protein [Hyphomicrobium sp.]
MSLIQWLKSLLAGPRERGISPFPAGQGPARVLVMRHGEKTGDRSDPHLSAEGRQRAGKLAVYVPRQFGKPDFLIAAAQNKRSNRPHETLAPLAAACNLAIIDGFDDRQVGGVIQMLSNGARFAGAFGVICWRHSDLPPLIAALGAPEGAFPDPWDAARFDLLIDIAYADAAEPRVRQITPPF